MRAVFWVLTLSALLAPTPASAWPTCKGRALIDAPPAELGLDSSLVGDLNAVLYDAVATGQTHSVSLVALRRGKVFFRGSAGAPRPDSIFDVASLTKVVATTPSVMQLVESRKLFLSSKAASYLKLLSTADKRLITVKQLLLHTSGLGSGVKAGGITDRRPDILARIRRSKMLAMPGKRYRYSDIGYILLGELVRALAGVPLDIYSQNRLFVPLEMCNTGFNPPSRLWTQLTNPWPNSKISPWPGGRTIGLVYDPLAARMSGVAGHAGLYSTAEDLARFGQMMLEGGKLLGKRVLSRRTVALMTRPYSLPDEKDGHRGLGWDISSPHATACKGSLSPRAFGHTGFTGTSLWIDPQHELVIALLTNRTYFEKAPPINGLRRRVHEVITSSLLRSPDRPVEAGLDRLVKNQFSSLRGQRVALITNKTAVDKKGRWIGDLLWQAPQVTWVALFVPEHGLKGQLDRSIKDGVLRKGKRQIPMYSLFGTRRRPTPETLAGVDTILFDIQAIGVRYYTYLATLGWAMEEAAKHRLRFVVLDRPNPLGGEVVQGPVSGTAWRTSTNYHPLPVRYGMTLGELAQLFNGERRLGVRLSVIRLRAWRREHPFADFGGPWIDPSPNIHSWRQALLYAGVGLLESTNVSVGRGTDRPFQLVGAPWIDGPRLTAQMNRRQLAGIYFTTASFTPGANPYRGKTCQGVHLVVTDPQHLDPVVVGVALAVSLRQSYPHRWETKNLFRLINHPPTTEAILSNKEVADILPLWSSGLARFSRIRSRYLLY